MSLIPSNCPKPDLFLYKRNSEDNNPIDVTDYKIDDLINLATQEESELHVLCLYESSNLSAPIISNIQFDCSDDIVLSADLVKSRAINNEIAYNNKTYYRYFMLLI